MEASSEGKPAAKRNGEDVQDSRVKAEPELGVADMDGWELLRIER